MSYTHVGEVHAGVWIRRQKGKLGELKKTWESFRNTRDTQIIPAIYGGKVEEAKAIAGGVQKERCKKMSSIVDELIWKK